MKRIISLLLGCVLVISMVACASTNVVNKESKGKSVSAIFVGIDKQPSGGADELIDTIWIYFDDETFEQYAEVDKEMVLFSLGNYHFVNDGNFIDGQKDSSKGQITIDRTKKYQYGKGLTDYSSHHTYDLSAIGFKCVFAQNKEK
ncbi:MAG: hypothetical protein IJP71_03320 [Lachnospiraceae bacterium]|nr:hypothetical protein [Lachnospiraceae bacterium]